MASDSEVLTIKAEKRDFARMFFEKLNPGGSFVYEVQFRTVFYRTQYSYCYCMCSYEHEYFDYLSDKGDIVLVNEIVFERIIQSIIDGMCPHAKEVQEKYLATTTVNGELIRAIGGSRDALGSCIWSSRYHIYHDSPSIFKLHPLVNIILKNSCDISNIFCDQQTKSELWNVRFLYPRNLKPRKTNKIIHWERISLLECCARQRNILLLQQLLEPYNSSTWTCDQMTTVCDLAFKYDLKEIIQSVIVKGFDTFSKRDTNRLDQHMQDDKTRKLERLICADAAIVYNSPTTLDQIITMLANKTDRQDMDKLVFTSFVLKRTECHAVLLKNGFHEHGLTVEEQQKQLFHVLLNFSMCRHEVLSIMQQYEKIWIPSSHKYFDVKLSFSHTSSSDQQSSYYRIDLNCLDGQICCRRLSREAFTELLLLIGADLTENLIHSVNRELLELCLFLNISNLQGLLNKSPSQCIDESEISRNDIGLLGQDYIMDAKEHSLFDEKQFALNFTLPLLIECGFNFDRSFIENILNLAEEEAKLHHSEKEYLTNYLECLRPLKYLCRDALRRHFPNRQIHKYMSVSNFPCEIKDFILLKAELPTLRYSHVGTLLL